MSNQASTRTILFALFALVYAFGGAASASNTFHHDFSMISKIFIFIFGWVGGFLGQFVGMWVKDKMKPDLIIAENQTDIWKHQFLWFVLPPLIGGLIGSAIFAMFWIVPTSWIVGFPLSTR